jgi:hypothetical protein
MITIGDPGRRSIRVFLTKPHLAHGASLLILIYANLNLASPRRLSRNKVVGGPITIGGLVQVDEKGSAETRRPEVSSPQEVAPWGGFVVRCSGRGHMSADDWPGTEILLNYKSP